MDGESSSWLHSNLFFINLPVNRFFKKLCLNPKKLIWKIIVEILVSSVFEKTHSSPKNTSFLIFWNDIRFFHPCGPFFLGKKSLFLIREIFLHQLKKLKI